MTATSHLTGKTVNRFCHIHQSTDDLVTLPSDANFRSPEAGKWLKTYFRGKKGISTENRRRILRLIENICFGTAAVGYLTESMHGAGFPQAQQIMISRQVNMKEKQPMAKKLSGISD